MTRGDESQSVPSSEKPFKTRDLELPFFEGPLQSCSPHSAGYTRAFLHPYFPVAKKMVRRHFFTELAFTTRICRHGHAENGYEYRKSFNHVHVQKRGFTKFSVFLKRVSLLSSGEKLHTPPPLPPPDFGQKAFLRERGGGVVYFEAPAAGILYPPPLLYALRP